MPGELRAGLFLAATVHSFLVLVILNAAVLTILAAPDHVVRRIRVAGNLEQKKLVYSVEPIYPPDAKEAKVEGDVILEVLIDANGHVTKIQVVSGDKLFNMAAMRAVRQWRYSPTFVGGEPVEVITSVLVRFRLN